MFTGAPITPDAYAVVIQKKCQLDGRDADMRVTIAITVKPGKNIRRAGEEIKQAKKA